MATNGEKRAEIYTYEAPWMIYAANWSVRATTKRLGGLTRARRRATARIEREWNIPFVAPRV
jgi:hypothetical protein